MAIIEIRALKMSEVHFEADFVHLQISHIIVILYTHVIVTLIECTDYARYRRTRRSRPGRWALGYSTGAQEGFWGPGVLPLPDFSIAPYPAPPGTPETSQMGLYVP